MCVCLCIIYVSLLTLDIAAICCALFKELLMKNKDFLCCLSSKSRALVWVHGRKTYNLFFIQKTTTTMKKLETWRVTNHPSRLVLMMGYYQTKNLRMSLDLRYLVANPEQNWGSMLEDWNSYVLLYQSLARTLWLIPIACRIMKIIHFRACCFYFNIWLDL